MTPIDVLAPTYVTMLTAMAEWLEKAEAQADVPDGEALLAARLAPDMFPLSTQVRFACVQALEGMHRLRSMAFPELVGQVLEEGQNGSENPGTVAAARARIDETIAIVRDLADGDAAVPDTIAHAIPNGMVFDLTTEQYVRDWAVGQFYFHVMIGYAILRNVGADLGKADFSAHMFPFVRPGTMPQG